MRVRDERGALSRAALSMLGGGAILVIAIVWFAVGGHSKTTAKGPSTQCTFPACKAAFDPGGGRGFEGPSVAVDPKDEAHMVVTDANMSAGQCTWHTTFDQGKTWTDGTFTVPQFTGCHINAGAGGHVPTGPDSVAIGPSGTVYATYGSATPSQGTRESIILARSTDGGKTFQTAVALAPPGDDLSYARPEMSVVAGTAGKDRVLLSFWQCRQGGRFCDTALFARSDDGGGTFTPAITVNDAPAGQTPSAPLQGPDGTIYITFARRFADGPTDLVLARSTDGGMTYTYSPIDSEPSIGDQYDPGKLAWDGADKTLLVTYTDARAGNKQQLFFRTSADQGKTWTPVVGLGPDADPTQSGTSRSPAIGVAPDGRIDIVYYRTPQANTDNVFWAYSLDGGKTFASRQVNSQPIQRYPFTINAIGTWYPPAVSSLNDVAVVAWSDTLGLQDQNLSTQDVYLRRMLPPGGDIPP